MSAVLATVYRSTAALGPLNSAKTLAGGSIDVENVGGGGVGGRMVVVAAPTIATATITATAATKAAPVALVCRAEV